ncbi:MAG: hypothetical protein K2X28_08685 [Alphaproteobacteria bacterium]|nr:hypothetical protein [Alphaproteobacteria bacterium]
MRFVLFLLTFTLLSSPGFTMENEQEEASGSSVIRKDGRNEKENDEDYEEIPCKELNLESFTILKNPELGVEYTPPFTKDPHLNDANSYNEYIHGWLEINLKGEGEEEGEGEKLLEKIMGTLIGPNQVLIPAKNLQDLSTWNPSKITFFPVSEKQDATRRFVEAFSNDVIVFNDGQIEKITLQKGEKLPSNGACIFFLKEAIGNKMGYAGLGAVLPNFLRIPDVRLVGALLDDPKRVQMYREKSSIMERGENFFEIDTNLTSNRTNELLLSQLPKTLGYSVIGYAGAQPHIFQRFTTSSLNKLVEALNSSPNSKRPAAIGPIDHYGAIEGFTIISSEESTAPLTSAKGKAPTRDFPLEYSEDSRKALEGNLRRWAYIYVEDRTSLRPLFLLMKSASAFHPLVTNMIPLLFKFYYGPNKLKGLDKKIDLKEFYDAGLAQLALSLASTIQQAASDSTAIDTEKKLNLFPREQRESWRFILEPAQLQVRIKSEFTRLEQEVESEQRLSSGNLNPLCSLALCYIWGWGCEQDIDKAIEYLETGVKETENFEKARAYVTRDNPSQPSLKANETLARAYEILGHLYSYKCVQEKAYANYTGLENISSDGDLHLANYYFAGKENRKAFEHLKAAVKKRNPIALRTWIKVGEERRKKVWGPVSISSGSEHTNAEKLKQLFHALNTKIQAKKLKSLLEKIESEDLGIKALPLLWPHYFFGQGCKQDYFLAALSYAIPYIARDLDILKELKFSGVKGLVSLFRSWDENKEKDLIISKLQELAKKAIMKRMGSAQPYEDKYFEELFKKASDGDKNARSCLGHCYMLKQGAKEEVQPNFQKAAVTFYIAKGAKYDFWEPLSEWLAINDASKIPHHPFITRFLKVEKIKFFKAGEANWLLPENRHKESETVDIEWIQLCENLGEIGYPIGWYKAAKYSMDYAPSYALSCLSQVVEAYHPKLDALHARLYFTVEGIFGMQENREEDREKKQLRRKKALGYWLNIAAKGEGKVQGEAQFYAGVCHLKGWGTKINKQHAIELLNLAQANGYKPNAKTISSFKKEKILELYKNLQKQARIYWENLATNGKGEVQREAQYHAGACYFQGWGTKINKKRAEELFKLAKANGYQPDERTISSFKEKEILEFYENISMDKPKGRGLFSWK